MKILFDINKDVISKSLLLLYVVSIVLFSYQEFNTLYSKVAALLLVVYFLLSIVLKVKHAKSTREYTILMLWMCIALISTMFANNQDLSFSKFLTLIQVFSISYIIFNLIVWQRDATSFWMSLVVTALISSFITLSNPMAYIGHDGRMAGTVGNANLFGVLLLCAFIVSLCYVYKYKSIFIKLFFLLIVIFLFYMLLGTGSRKAIIGTTIVIILIGGVNTFSLLKQSVAKFILVSSFGFIVLTSGLTYLLNSRHYHRIEGLFLAAESGDASKSDRSLEGRLQFYEQGIDIILSNPILGVGLDNYRDMRVGVFSSKIGTYSHSNFVELAVSTGIIGLIIYLCIYLSIALKLFKSRGAIKDNELRQEYLIVLSMLLIFVMFDFAMVTYYEKLSWLIMSGIIASVLLTTERYKNEQK